MAKYADSAGATLDSQLEQVAQLAAKARRIVVSTGAGVSAESGIPTFRDAQTGLWSRYDPVMLASYQGFTADPAGVWRWYDERRQTMAAAQPNPGHYALAHWESLAAAAGQEFTLATQNIDGLHARAGSRKPLELHGNIWAARPLDGRYEEATELLDCPLAELPPLDCAGRLLRPHVVWFGEMLHEPTLQAAFEAASAADLLLVIGSSSEVFPAAQMPYLAKSAGATVVEINPSRTELSVSVHYSLRAASGVVLPALLKLIHELQGTAQVVKAAV